MSAIAHIETEILANLANPQLLVHVTDTDGLRQPPVADGTIGLPTAAGLGMAAAH